MADRVEGLVSGQRRWLAAISHELKTPVTRLRLQAEGLDSESMLEDIEDLENLIETMVASARLQSEAVPLQVSRVEIDTLVMTALGSVELHERTVDLQLEDGLVVEGDWDLLLRVVSNVLSNVSRYTPEDACVWIRGYVESQRLCLQMADNGPGLSADLMQRIFDPFVRSDERSQGYWRFRAWHDAGEADCGATSGTGFAERHDSGGLRAFDTSAFARWR